MIEAGERCAKNMKHTGEEEFLGLCVYAMAQNVCKLHGQNNKTIMLCPKLGHFYNRAFPDHILPKEDF